MEKMNLDEVDIVEDGILWAINRVLFHPRGYALAYEPTEAVFYLWGDGSEPWTFNVDGKPGSLDEDRFKSFEALLEGRRPG